jgi:phosphate transport system permease protein
MKAKAEATVSTVSSGFRFKLTGLNRIGDKIFPRAALFFALLLVGILAAAVIVLGRDALPAIKEFGLHFLGSTAWDSVKGDFGALPAIFGTLLSSLIALIIAVPVSLGTAVFLVELSPAWLRSPASFLVEILAAVPSVIIGLWGLFILVPFIQDPVEKFLGEYLGFLPFFKGPPFGVGFLAAGFILAIMIIPIITSVCREAIKAVPGTQKEAMLALGATRWEAIRRAVLPYCRSGLVGGVILGLGRAMGETMAVAMVIGNSYELTASLFSPGTTVASKIAGEFGEASTEIFISSLIELA